MTEVIVSGFVSRSRRRLLDLNKNPIIYDYTDSEGWSEWFYATGKSAGINPMIYTSKSKALQNSEKDGLFKRKVYKGFGTDNKPKFEITGYSEYQVEIIPVDLVFSG